jgi:hypothetical protein
MGKLLLLILLSVPLGLFAQVSTGSLSVHVVDENGDDFFGAGIFIYEGERLITGNETDPFGSAVISGLEPGKYTVKICFVGYQWTMCSVEVSSNQITCIDGSLFHHFNCLCDNYNYCQQQFAKDIFTGTTTWTTDQILKMPVR